MKNDTKNSHAAADKNQPGRPRIRLRCRLEQAVHEHYGTQPDRLSAAVRAVLQRFRLLLRSGLFRLEKRSHFRGRPDLADKVELTVRLTRADKDLLEKLAFALRLSQAEVLRMALEWGMAEDGEKEKWHHDQIELKPCTMNFSFWTPNRRLEWQLPPVPTLRRTLSALARAGIDIQPWGILR